MTEQAGVSDARRRALEALVRGPVSELELTDEDKAGLPVQERMSLAKKVAFLRAFALRGIPLDGQIAAGVARTTIKYWRDTDEWFETLHGAALEEAADRVEAEVHRRAIQGVDEPVIHQGMPTELVNPDTGERRMFTVKKYSDQLAALLLRGQKREKYGESVKVEPGAGQVGVLIVPAAVDPKSWAEATREQQAKFAGNQGEAKK